ncbi:MAG: hypothetical protein E6K39_00655 [Gammaproteobacteria bacterium]|nr:MAG: hypothetical protein E6K39_00655 [Gammaproteobacteria bacterium]
MAGTLMHEAGVPLRRAQEILGHASERTTLPICTHAMRRTRDDSVDKIAELARLSKVGNSRETAGSVEAEEAELSACFSGSPGWTRTNSYVVESEPEFRKRRGSYADSYPTKRALSGYKLRRLLPPFDARRTVTVSLPVQEFHVGALLVHVDRGFPWGKHASTAAQFSFSLFWQQQVVPALYRRRSSHTRSSPRRV